MHTAQMSINVMQLKCSPENFPNKAYGAGHQTDVRGQSLPCGHHLPQEIPDERYEVFSSFLKE
jgi:hypothetical protein